MTDRPILFSGPMVRALLEGQKSQTRRLLKPQPHDAARYAGVHFAHDEPNSWFFNGPAGPMKIRERFAVDDVLWVREAWAVAAVFNNAAPRSLPIGMAVQYAVGGMADRTGFIDSVGRYRPGMFLPRWASRLTLTVTDVRVQRLQEISRDDVIAEGISERDGEPIAGVVVGWHEPYAALWDSLNAKRAPWASSPWVVAVTFDVAQRNIDQQAAA